MPEDPIRIWQDLEQSGRGDGIFDVVSRSSGTETGYGPARFALGPGRERRLLVPCAQGVGGKELKGGPKLATAVVSYSSANGHQPFIDILCHDRRLDVVFAELCREILKRLGDGEGPLDAVIGTISDFRELLLSGAPTTVARSEVVGLLGELLVLRQLTGEDPDAAAAWTGPFEQRHDFRRGTRALEVKTSSRADATKVTINGSHQLLAPANGELCLVHVRIEAAGSGSLTVGRVFDDLVATGADEERLRTGLGALGCPDPHDEAWNSFAFELQGTDAYRVISGFPRVTPEQFSDGNVPEAISSLKYDVDLPVAGEFRMSADELSEYIDEMMK
ncbi:MAG: PD-(D/E)XK motif protein [Pseudomonadota bacterium]